MAAHQVFAVLFNPCDRHIKAGGDRHSRELHSRSAGRFQHSALVGAEPLDLLFDQLFDARRNSVFDF